MSYPSNYRYTKEHEWLNIDGDTALVGITDHAQSQLGDIVFVELPKADQKLEAGESFGTIESVKAVSELYAPVDGTVIGVNDELNDEPEQLNQDANTIWIIKLKLADKDSGKDLLSAADYEKYIAEESGH